MATPEQKPDYSKEDPSKKAAELLELVKKASAEVGEKKPKEVVQKEVMDMLKKELEGRTVEQKKNLIEAMRKNIDAERERTGKLTDLEVRLGVITLLADVKDQVIKETPQESWYEKLVPAFLSDGNEQPKWLRKVFGWVKTSFLTVKGGLGDFIEVKPSLCRHYAVDAALDIAHDYQSDGSFKRNISVDIDSVAQKAQSLFKDPSTVRDTVYPWIEENLKTAIAQNPGKPIKINGSFLNDPAKAKAEAEAAKTTKEKEEQTKAANDKKQNAVTTFGGVVESVEFGSATSAQRVGGKWKVTMLEDQFKGALSGDAVLLKKALDAKPNVVTAINIVGASQGFSLANSAEGVFTAQIGKEDVIAHLDAVAGALKASNVRTLKEDTEGAIRTGKPTLRLTTNGTPALLYSGVLFQTLGTIPADEIKTTTVQTDWLYDGKAWVKPPEAKK